MFINSKIDLRILIIGLLGVSIFLLPFDLNLNSYGIALSVCLWLYGMTTGQFKIAQKEIKSIIIHSSPLLLAILGLLYTSNLEYGIGFVVRLTSFLIFPLLFISIKYNAKEVSFFLIAFALGCLLCYLHSILKYLEYDIGTLPTRLLDENFIFKFNEFFAIQVMHPTYYSMFFLLNTFSFAYLFSKSKSQFKKAGFAIATITFTLFMISLTAKMPMVTLMVVLLLFPFVYLYRNTAKRGVLFYFLILTVTFLMGYWFVRTVPNRAVQEVNNYYNYLKGEELEDYYEYDKLAVAYDTFWFRKTNRIVIWKNSIELIEQSPWIGFGTGDVEDELIATYKKNKELWRMQFFNSHNQYFDYQLRYGILGSLVLIFLLVYLFRFAWTHNDYLYIAFLLIFVLGFLSENLIQRHWGIVFFTFFNSLFYFRNYDN